MGDIGHVGGPVSGAACIRPRKHVISDAIAANCPPEAGHTGLQVLKLQCTPITSVLQRHG